LKDWKIVRRWDWRPVLRSETDIFSLETLNRAYWTVWQAATIDEDFCVVFEAA